MENSKSVPNLTVKCRTFHFTWKIPQDVLKHSPGALLGLLPVPNQDIEGGLRVGLACREKEAC